MRAVFGILSLVIVLLIVGSLVKKQMAATTAPIPALQTPSINPAATQREQAQQIQQQIKQTIDAQMQARPMPEDSK
jgi:hypothetical protein